MIDSTHRHTQTILRMRRTIGFIGLTLPLVLLAGVWIFGVPMQDSISEFFFTEMREVFVSAAAGVGMFLMAYQGYPRGHREYFSDRWVTTIAGLAAFTLSMVPTRCDQMDCYRPLSLLDRLLPPALEQLQNSIHFGAASVFFIALGVISTRIFTRCDASTRSLYKKRRDVCYTGFGVTIFTMGAFVGVMKFAFNDTAEIWNESWHFTFWAESIALSAFGFSWLLKGRTLPSLLTYFYGLDEA